MHSRWVYSSVTPDITECPTPSSPDSVPVGAYTMLGPVNVGGPHLALTGRPTHAAAITLSGYALALGATTLGLWIVGGLSSPTLECVDALIWRDHPELRDPILVAAFEGWNDAAEAASDAAVWLIQEFDGRAVAGIDPEDFINFQEHRPRIQLRDGITRQLQWPGNEFYAISLPGAQRDVVVLLGIEPHNRWRTFTDTVIAAADALGCRELVTFGALLADAPHTREPSVTGIGVDDAQQRFLELAPSSYEGPTGIVGVLHDAWRRHDRRATSLWVPVPHYIASPPNPVAIRALLRRFERLAEVSLDMRELDSQVVAWRERVDAIVADDEEAREYVERLEQEADEDTQLSEASLPSGDAIAAELEAFLRNRDE